MHEKQVARARIHVVKRARFSEFLLCYGRYITVRKLIMLIGTWTALFGGRKESGPVPISINKVFFPLVDENLDRTSPGN